MDGRTTSLGVRLTPALKKALTRAAHDDCRSMSNLIEALATDAMRSRGYLEAPTKRRSQRMAPRRHG
jgi:hypothetical protein